MAKRYELAIKYTEKYRSVLPPCRYCGNTDVRICTDRTIFGPSRNTWFVACQTPKCDCTDSFTRVKDAVSAWIRRTAAANTVKEETL